MPEAAVRSIITGEMESHYPRLVVGYDGSDTDRAAVAHAARRASHNVRLVVVHASGSRHGTGSRGELDHRQAVLDVLLIQAGDALRGCHFELLLVPGSPARALASVAEEQDASEIVVGVGHVADELAEITRRRVVVVPPGLPSGRPGIRAEAGGPGRRT